jgi:putative membrane protein
VTTSRTLRARALWLVGAVILPFILIGALLGVVSAGDDALERVPVALVNNDELITEIDDNGDEQFFFASRPLVQALVGGDDLQLEWVITNTTQANLMLSRGEVYAVFEIPANFSKAVQTLGTENPEQARFTIRTDPTRSYLAGVLVDQLGPGIAATISKEFGKELTKGLFVAVVELGDAFQETADGAAEIAKGTDTLAEGTQELATGVRELRTGTQDLATGYATFDNGLGEYLSGVRSLADGVNTFERETRGLPELATGISNYTGGVSGVAGGLSLLNGAGAFGSITDTDEQTRLQVQGLLLTLGVPTEGLNTEQQFRVLLQILAGLGFEGTKLTEEGTLALALVRDGIVDVNTGATALSSASAPLRSGSTDIRSGVSELAEGVTELNDGVQELNDGVQELNDGVQEFAEALSEGAEEIQSQSFGEPNDETLEVLSQPVAFDTQDRTGEIGLLGTLSSVFIPIGLWFVALVFFLTRPALNHAMLAGTAATRTLLARSIRPVLGAVAGHVVVATALLHALGGVSWWSVLWTLPLIAVGSSTYMALHYLVWLWRPRWLGPASITLGVVQIMTLGSLLPREILPGIYQAFTGLTPIGWFIDSLQSAIAGAGLGRVFPGVLALVFVSVISLVLSGVALRSARLRTQLAQLGFESAPDPATHREDTVHA